MWFWLALGSAVFGAIDVTLNKHLLNKVSAGVLSWSLFTLSIPPLIYLVLKDGIPNSNQMFLVGTVGSAFTYVFSKTITNHTLKHNLISKILPITAFTGLFTYILGLILLSETLRVIPVIGLISIIFGSYILNADQAKEDFFKPFKILFTTKTSIFLLIALLLGSMTVIFDKLALINTIPQSPAFTFLIEQIIMSIMLTPYLFYKENKTWVKELKNNFGILFINSILFLIAGFFVFYAYKESGPVALVMGIKRLQIFFILLLGYLLFKDKPTKHTWAATAIMVLGVLMIKLG